MLVGTRRSRSGGSPFARRAVQAVVLALVGTSVVHAAGPALGAVPAYCSLSWPGQVRFVWDGQAGDGRWSTDANWSNDTEPSMVHGSNGYVCIPGAATVTLAAGERADLQALDVRGGGTLVMEVGSKIYVYGDQATRPSVVRETATLAMSGAFGGPGRLDLLGQMQWRSTVSGASTLTTRDCALDGSCAAPVEGPTGHLEVGDTGLVLIDDRGVNLEDQYGIVVRGEVRLANQGYIAADRGTSFELRPQLSSPGVGQLTITNNGGYYEGRSLVGLTTLSTFVNAGRILKSAGNGTSVVSATYSVEGDGQVQVDAGTLTLPDGVTEPAQVAGGRSYGTGRCTDFSEYACLPLTEPGVDVQNATLQVPSADTNGSQIQVTEVSGGPADRIGSTLRLHSTGLAATRRAPAVLTMRYDSSLLAGRTWQDVHIHRRADGATAYKRVPPCTDQGRPPTGAVACVDRRGLAGSSRDVTDPGDPLGAPVDVVMVVRTTATSRWVGR